MNSQAVRTLYFCFFVCCILLCGCSDNDGNPGSITGDSLVTEVSVSPDFVKLGDEITVTITWKNDTNEQVIFYFDSMKINDFEINGTEGPLGAHSGDYAVVDGEVRVAAGGELVKRYRFIMNPGSPSDSVVWVDPSLPLESGVYSVTGGIVGYSDDMPWGDANFRVVD